MKPFSILLLDIDRFKRVNDTYGHSIGDEVLKFIAIEMNELARELDVCCRYGGEEFIILMPETTEEEAYDLSEQLRKKLENTVSPTGEAITISGGVEKFPVVREDMTVIEVADERLYKAKESGRNQIIGVYI